MNQPLILLIDLFCGAGGTTIAFEKAKIKGNKVAKVIACVNHDAKAIESHWLNHPEVKHFEEDIRTLDLTELVQVIKDAKMQFSQAKVVLWASLECTNFSKAKGGKARDADSRTLAWHLPRYIEGLSPDAVMIENVVEFMSWGELDKNGKPISKRNGTEWLKWKEFIKDEFGYRDEWRELNSANFGAYTSRNRLFGIFAKDDFPICFPNPTHSKNLKSNLFQTIKPWKAVRDVLDLNDAGNSIFERTKSLSEKTLERILAGLVKYVAKGDKAFLQTYYSGNPNSKVQSVEDVCGTLTTIPHQGIVSASFLQRYNSGLPESHVISLNKPACTLTTKDTLSVVFLDKFYSGPHNHQSIDEPAGTLTTKDRFSTINCQYLLNPQYCNNGADIEKPCFTLIARMDKAPPYLVSSEEGKGGMIVIYPDDSDVMIRIKKFMAFHGIVDIKMRMLKVLELKRIQGFPEEYILKGTQADQKNLLEIPFSQIPFANG